MNLLGRIVTVYLDNCCNSRLFDDDTQPKVKAEAAKIRHIINNRIIEGYIIIGSFAVRTEIGQITNDKKRRAAEKHYKKAIDGTVESSAQIIARAEELRLLMRLDMMDSRHLAAAEAAGADFLLTTDEKFIRKCKNRNLTAVNVINPIDFERRLSWQR